MAKTRSWGHHSEQAKQKIREANLGRKLSAAVKAKISAAQKRNWRAMKNALLARDRAA
jgi:hypothetical protein